MGYVDFIMYGTLDAPYTKSRELRYKPDKMDAL